MPRGVYAASATWNANPTDGNWITSTGSNWSTGPGIFPGDTTGTTNVDIATFNSASSFTSISLNQGLNIGSVAFDAGASSYTVGASGGGSLLLSSGGSVSILSTLTNGNLTETIAAPIVLEGNYAFSNYATAPSTVLNFSGKQITAAIPNTVLTLGGSNTGLNTISAAITDGSAGRLALLKTGAGTWILSGANSYSGPTQIDDGTLEFTGTNFLGNDVLGNGGALLLSGSNEIGGNLIGNGAVITMGSGNSIDGNLTANAATISMDTNSTIAGNLYGNGGTVSKGDGASINGNLYGHGATILLGASPEIDGDLTASAGKVTTGANGNIYGNVTSGGTSTSISIGAGTQVYGIVTDNLGSIVFGPGAIIDGSIYAEGGTISMNGGGEIDGSVYADAGTTVINGPTTIYNDVIANGGSAWLNGTNTVSGVITANAGTITLSGSNTVASSVGTTGNGTLVLDFTGTPGQNILVPATPLAMAGGTLQVRAAGSSSDSQQFAGLTLGDGESSIQITSTASNSVLLALGPIVRKPTALVDFSLPAGAPSATNGITTTTPNANFPGGQSSILGGYATVGDTWAVSASDGTNPGLISALAAYTAVSTDFGATTSVAAKDVDVIGTNAAATSSPVTVNSLRFNVGNNTLNLGAAVAVATGGILVGTGSSGGMIQGGSITSGNGTNLILIDKAAGRFAINSIITDNGVTPIGLTKAGSGQYSSNSQSTYTGPTTLLSGSVVAESSTSGGTPGNPAAGPFGRGTLVFDGAQFRASTNPTSTTLSNAVTFAADTTFVGAQGQGMLTFTGPITLAGGTRTLTNNSANDVVFAGPIGDGQSGYGLTLTGTGRTILSGANTYAGYTIIMGGVALANTPAGGSASGRGTVFVNAGGVLAGTGVIAPAPSVPVVIESGGIISAGTGANAADTPGALTLATNAWFGSGPAAALPASQVVKFNPKNLGNGGAIVGGDNPTATADPGGPGANWDQITMQTINLVATPNAPVGLTTINLTPYGTSNAFNSSSTYAWPVAVIKNGVPGFYVNGATAAPSGSQADLRATIASLYRLDPTGLEMATGVYNPRAFSVGVAPDPANSAFEDVVISYAPAPEPTGLMLFGTGAAAFLALPRRRARPNAVK